MKFDKTIENIKRKFDNYSNIYNIFVFVIMAFLSFEIVRNVVYCAESEFQMHRDIYTFKAAAFFLVLILIIRRENLFKLPYLFTVIGYGIYMYRNMTIYTPEDYGPDLSNWHLQILIANGIFLLTFIDFALNYKNRAKAARMNWYGLATIGIGVIFLGINYSYSRIFLFPLMALFMTDMTKKTWRRFIDAFAIGYYLAFLYVFTNSYLTIQDLFKGHYYGTFLNVATGQAFCVGAVICAIYGILRARELNIKALLVTSAVLIPYPVFAVVLFNERSGYLSLFLVAAFLAVFFRYDDIKRAGWQKRAFISVGVLAAIIAVSVVGLVIFAHSDTQKLKEFLFYNVNEDLAYTVDMYMRRAQGLINMESSLHIIPDGSWLIPIDNLSSWRLSYWVNSFERTTLWGDGMLYVGNEFFESTNPHSTFVSMYRMYGYIGGTLFFGWTMTTFVKIIRKILKGETDLDFSFIWIVFFVTYSLVETALWTYTMGFIFLIVIYPLVKNFVSEET